MDLPMVALITLSLLGLGACCRAWTGSLSRPRYEPEPKGCSSQAAQTTRTSAQLGATLRRAARGGKSLTPVKWTPQTPKIKVRIAGTARRKDFQATEEITALDHRPR